MTPHISFRHFMCSVALAALLLSQTGCMAAMQAANQHEVDERHKVKAWIAQNPAYADCEKAPLIAPIRYYDFDRDPARSDNAEELIVEAATCKAGTAGPDIHAVLTPTGESNFIVWQIPELGEELATAADLQGNTHYRLSLEGSMLVATWKDPSGQGNPPLTVKYAPVGGDSRAFAIYETTPAQ